MRNPKPLKPQDSTPVEPNWGKLRLKFFLSLCLFGFLAGMMLRQLTGNSAVQHNQLLSVIPLPAGLELCFSHPPEVQQAHDGSAAAMWNIAQVAQTPRQQGELLMAQGEMASWILLWHEQRLQLGVTALGQIHQQWRRSNDNCVVFAVSRQI